MMPLLKCTSYEGETGRLRTRRPRGGNVLRAAEGGRYQDDGRARHLDRGPCCHAGFKRGRIFAMERPRPGAVGQFKGISEDETMRAQRRADSERMKARARKIMGLWSQGLPVAAEHSPRDVGRNASTHCRPCSCHMCRNDEPSKQERAMRESEKSFAFDR